MEAVITY